MNSIADLMDDYGKTIARATQNFSPDEYARTAKRLRWFFRNRLPADRSARILDVGCGAGHFLYFLRQEGYTNIEGLDASLDRVELCRRHVTANVHQADALDWVKSRPRAYDVVVSNHVIEHLADEPLMSFLRALTDAVAEGGTLILTTPNGCTPWAGYNRFGDLTHCRLFTANSLAQLMAAFGFQGEFYAEGPAPYDAVGACRWLLWKVREALLKLSFQIDVGGLRGNQTTPLIVSQNLMMVCRRASGPS